MGRTKQVELVPPAAPPAAPPVKAGEMRKLCEQARKGFEAMVNALIALKYRQGWHVLAYSTFQEAVDAEFGRTQQWADEQIWLHEVNRRYLPPPTGQTITTAVVRLGIQAGRELRKLDAEEDQKAAVGEALEMCREGQEAKELSGKVHIVVDRYVAERSEPEAPEEPPPMVDELGNEVPEELRPAFEGTKALKDLATALWAETQPGHPRDGTQSGCGHPGVPD